MTPYYTAFSISERHIISCSNINVHLGRRQFLLFTYQLWKNKTELFWFEIKKFLFLICSRTNLYFEGDNVLKDSEGVYKIADFGLSKRCNLDSSSGIYSPMTAGVGTPSHMAPEVKNPTGNVQYDTKADIW